MDNNKKRMTNEKNFLKKRKCWTQYDFENNSIICKVSQNMGSFFQSLEEKKRLTILFYFSPQNFFKVSPSLILLS
jgi:hypothetical protein